MKVQLAFAEPFEDGFSSRMGTYAPEEIPSKVGGLPVWLNQKNPLSSSQASCTTCLQPMNLLLQLFTQEKQIEAFHRIIYIFVCRNGKCFNSYSEKNKSIKVFRSQLPEEPEDYNESLIPFKTDLCRICHLKGTSQCMNCQDAFYCSKTHQKLDLVQGNHKLNCATLITVDYGFPELEIVIEDEATEEIDSQKDLDTLAKNVSISSEMTDALDAMNFDEEAEDCEDSQVTVDAAFLEFQKRVNAEPEQILRYARHHEETVEDNEEEFIAQNDEEIDVQKPLLANDLQQPTIENIGNCQGCGHARQFEFQIMPQILNYLDIDHASPDAIDFGTLLVYTCPQNCSTLHSNGYIEEYIFKQDFTKDGMQKLWNKESREE